MASSDTQCSEQVKTAPPLRTRRIIQDRIARKLLRRPACRPVAWRRRAALIFLVSRAFCSQASAISICFLYSSGLSSQIRAFADQQVHVGHGVVVLLVDIQSFLQILRSRRRSMGPYFASSSSLTFLSFSGPGSSGFMRRLDARRHSERGIPLLIRDHAQAVVGFLFLGSTSSSLGSTWPPHRASSASRPAEAIEPG